MRPADTDLAKPEATPDDTVEEGGKVPTDLDYIEDLWQQEVDKNRALCSALKAVYALAGEVNGVKKIVEEALQEYETK